MSLGMRMWMLGDVHSHQSDKPRGTIVISDSPPPIRTDANVPNLLLKLHLFPSTTSPSFHPVYRHTESASIITAPSRQLTHDICSYIECWGARALWCLQSNQPPTSFSWSDNDNLPILHARISSKIKECTKPSSMASPEVA